MKQGEVRDAFLGVADGRYFGLMVGVGFDAFAVQKVPYGLKRILGRGSYLISGSASLIQYRYPSFEVIADGKSINATTVIIAKSPYYASRFRIAPEASLEEPQFQLIGFTGQGPLNYLKYTGALVWNRHLKLPDVIYLKARHVKIKPAEGVLSQMDGDLLSRVPGDIRIAKEVVRLLLPQDDEGFLPSLSLKAT